MVLAVIGVGELLRDFGLSSAAIQAPVLTRGQQTNLFWINTGLGALLTAATFIVAPLIASFYNQPELVPVARVLGVTFLLNGLAGQYRADLVRSMRFTRLAGLDVLAPTLAFLTALAIALAGGGYWALIAQQVAQSVVLLVGLSLSAGWLPRLPDRRAPVGGMLKFGANLVATQFVAYLANNADTFVIGKRFGAVELGLYNRGYQLITTTLSQLRTPTTTVALPVLSRIQDDIERFGGYVRRGQLVLGYTLVAGVAFVVGAAAPVVQIALGASWVGVTPVLQLLAVAGAMQTLAYVGYWVYLARGLTGALLRYSLLTAALKIIAIVIGSTGGPTGVALGIAIVATLEWPLSLWWLSRRTILPVRHLLLGALRISLMAALAAAATTAVIAIDPSQLWLVVPAALACLSTYALGCLVPAIRHDVADVLAVARSIVAKPRGGR